MPGSVAAILEARYSRAIQAVAACAARTQDTGRCIHLIPVLVTSAGFTCNIRSQQVTWDAFQFPFGPKARPKLLTHPVWRKLSNPTSSPGSVMAPGRTPHGVF